MRARNLKPSIFRNELLAVADPIYTVIFEGLWCVADRAGRLEDRPAKIHLEINPGRAFETTTRSLEWLAENGFIHRYESAGTKYIQVTNFSKHQNPHCKEPESTIPAPCEHSASTVAAVLIPDSGSLIPDPPNRAAEPPEWSLIRSEYPKRKGDHRWHEALGAAKARVKEGATWDDLLAGVRRYAAFVRADGKEHTPYVKQAATFFGKDKAFAEAWADSTPKKDPYANAL
jgi:hypothetical protein